MSDLLMTHADVKSCCAPVFWPERPGQIGALAAGGNRFAQRGGL